MIQRDGFLTPDEIKAELTLSAEFAPTTPMATTASAAPSSTST